MPVLITTLLIGWVAFFLHRAPPSRLAGTDSNEVVPNELNLTPRLSDDETVAAVAAVDGRKTAKLLPPPPDLEATGLAPATSLPLPQGELPLVSNDRVSESDFTPWMSPLALDTYIRQKNRGFEESFWVRGNWILAIEGRWQTDHHEFRIVHDTIPDRTRFEWYYRIDQTEGEYRDTLSRLRREGYHLVQSQAYERPDQTKRYQAVWHREIPGGSTSAAFPDLLDSAPGPNRAR